MFKKYPIVLQKDSKECGACCLSMIIKYYNGELPFEKIKENIKIDRNGATAYHIIKYAKEIGFEAKGVNCDLNTLIEKKKVLPAIASVTLNKTYKHYVIIYKITNKIVVICDPIDGIKKLDLNSFNKIFNNIIIILYPIRNIPYEKDKSSILMFTFNLLVDNKKIFINIILLSILITIYSVVNSFFIKYLIDGLSQTKSFILVLFINFITTYLAKDLTNYFRNYLLIYINQKIDYNLTMDTFKHIIKLPYQYYRNHPTGDIISRINDLESIKVLISKISMSLFIDSILTITSLFILFMISSKLGFVSIILMTCYSLIIIFFHSKTQSNINKVQNNRAESTSYMIEAITGIETVKGLHVENKIIDRFEDKYMKEINNSFKLSKLFNYENLLKDLVNNLGYVIVMSLGALFALDGEISLGELFVSESLLVYFLEPIKNIVNLDTQIKEANNSLKRVLNLYNKENCSKGILELDRVNSISLKRLNYIHNQKYNILKSINFKINKNERVIITGKSGSGKSTVLKLIMKYYHSNRNMIFINNKDLNDYDLNQIRDKIAYISQNEILFNDTILNNLKLDRNIDINFIYKVSKACMVDEIIKKEELGFNTLIEENGFNLSGGEKQRIILARALVSNKDVYIVDEGLNQVDISLERKILKNIFQMFPNKIFIVVSHRNENIDLFNHYIEISKGKVVKDLIYNG